MSNLSLFFQTKKCYTSVTFHVQHLRLQTSVLPKFRGVFISVLSCEKKVKSVTFSVFDDTT